MPPAGLVARILPRLFEAQWTLRLGASAAGGAFASVSSEIHCNFDGTAADSLLRGTFADDIMSVRESNLGEE